MSRFLRKLWKQKPSQWGGLSAVKRAVAENCESLYGINSSNILFVFPFWERAGSVIHDYGSFSINLLRTETAHTLWGGKGLSYDGLDNLQVQTLATPELINSSGEYHFVKGFLQNVENFDSDAVQNLARQANKYFTVLNTGALKFTESTYGTDCDAQSNADLLQDASEFAVSYNYRGGGILPSLYLNGEEMDYASRAAGTAGASTAGDILGIGCAPGDVLNSQFYGRIDCTYRFSQNLKSEQVALIDDNPYGLLARVPQVVYFLPTNVVSLEDDVTVATLRGSELMIVGEVLSDDINDIYVHSSETFTQGVTLTDDINALSVSSEESIIVGEVLNDDITLINAVSTESFVYGAILTDDVVAMRLISSESVIKGEVFTDNAHILELLSTEELLTAFILTDDIQQLILASSETMGSSSGFEDTVKIITVASSEYMGILRIIVNPLIQDVEEYKINDVRGYEIQ